MIVSNITLDISMEQWLKYAFLAIPNFIVTAVIIILVTLLLSFAIAIGWGLCWNKKWSLGKNARWFTVSIIAVVAAACLAARDSLCNGGFNSFSDEVSKVVVAFNDEPINQEDSKSAYEVARVYTFLFPDQTQSIDIEGDDTPILLDDKRLDSDESESELRAKYTVTSASGDTYKKCDSVLTYVPLFCFLLLLVVIPCVSYRDIRLIYPVPTGDTK